MKLLFFKKKLFSGPRNDNRRSRIQQYQRTGNKCKKENKIKFSKPLTIYDEKIFVLYFQNKVITEEQAVMKVKLQYIKGLGNLM